MKRYFFAGPIFGIPPSEPPPQGQWIVGNHSYTEDVVGTYNVLLSGPNGYVGGGVYGVDLSGTQLPSGVTLSEAGLESYDGAGAAASVAGIVYTYTEPNALPTFTLHNSGTTVTRPYRATVFPTEGVVPTGQALTSPDDTNLRSSTIATWPDGSARVVIVAGSTQVSGGSTKTIRLRTATPQGTALTASRIQTLVSSVVVNFGGGAQTLDNTALGSPTYVWWANSQVICARYYLSCGLGAMEAVIDIHAFATDYAEVEVVIENCKLTSSNPVATAPSPQSYTNATVAVNGTTIATQSDPPAMTWQGQPIYVASTHEAFRAWYCSAEIRSGSVFVPSTAEEKASNFGFEVTHDTASMQAHPLFYKVVTPIGFDPSTANKGSFQGVSQPYGSDAYQPWYYGRIVGYNMGQGGDVDGIGLYTRWDAHYLQSGSKFMRRSVLANALCGLHYTINYRDSGTKLVPTFAQLGTNNRNSGTWPSVSADPAWEAAHQPNLGLMAFFCKPSPCFIELTQKIATWIASFTNPTATPSAFLQTRGISWSMRNIGTSLFLTPTTVHSSVTAWASAVIPVWGRFLDFIEERKNHPQNLMFLLLHP
jgi:hypothetical protein